MWHVSVGNFTNRKAAKALALRVLKRYGNERLGQWIEVSDRFVHVRRRLTRVEQDIAGSPVDIRGTPAELEIVGRLSNMAAAIWRQNESTYN